MTGCCDHELRTDDLALHLKAQRAVGVPYTDDMIANAAPTPTARPHPDSPQADGVTKRYGKATRSAPSTACPAELTEMDALVAYLQVLGQLTDAAQQAGRAGGRRA